MTDLHESEVFKVFAFTSGDPQTIGQILTFSAISWDGYVWLVAKWLEALDGTHRVPERIIRVPSEALAATDQSPHARYRVEIPIPSSVLRGTQSEQDGFVAVQQPRIRVLAGSH